MTELGVMCRSLRLQICVNIILLKMPSEPVAKAKLTAKMFRSIKQMQN
jgi:hypothetical protein